MQRIKEKREEGRRFSFFFAAGRKRVSSAPREGRYGWRKKVFFLFFSARLIKEMAPQERKERDEGCCGYFLEKEKKLNWL